MLERTTSCPSALLLRHGLRGKSREALAVTNEPQSTLPEPSLISATVVPYIIPYILRGVEILAQMCNSHRQQRSPVQLSIPCFRDRNNTSTRQGSVHFLVHARLPSLPARKINTYLEYFGNPSIRSRLWTDDSYSLLIWRLVVPRILQL